MTEAAMEHKIVVQSILPFIRFPLPVFSWDFCGSSSREAGCCGCV